MTQAGTGRQFLALLAEPTATDLIRIPIAITGTWRGGDQEFSISLADLQDIRENFARKPTREINVDYEHTSEVPFGTGFPVLSAGRIVRLDPPKAKGEKHILWGWYEPTDRARQLIANREYRYISPAIKWGTKDKATGKSTGTALTSVALVNRPFLEELPELHLSELTLRGQTARRESNSLMTEVRTYARENNCSPSVALSEVSKQRPELRAEHSERVLASPENDMESAHRELSEAIEALCFVDGCTPAEALSRVAQEKPGLWRRYSEGITIVD